MALLGGEAGLRCGEMMALAFTGINVRRSRLCIQRSDWRGEVTVPKGGRLRYVPMTTRSQRRCGNIGICGVQRV